MRSEKLRMRNITVRDGKRCLLRNISFTAYANENICIYIPDDRDRIALLSVFEGTADIAGGMIFYDGKPVSSYKTKIHLVSSREGLVSQMSIAENLFLASDTFYSWGYLRRKEINLSAQEILKEAHLGHIQAKTPVYLLSPVEKKYIELLKTVAMGMETLILCDITSIYRTYEMERLKYLLKYLRDKGITIIYVTDKKTPLLELVQRIIYIQDGMILSNTECGERAFEAMMNSQRRKYELPPERLQYGKELLSVTDNENRKILQIPEGEIVGIYEEMWDKIPKLIEYISGDRGKRNKFEFHVFFEKMDFFPQNYQEVLKKGIVVIDENAHGKMIFYNMDLIENITLLADDLVMKCGLIYDKNLRRFVADEVLKKMGCEGLVESIQTEGQYNSRVKKSTEMIILIARMLCMGPKMFIFVNAHYNFDDMTISQFKEILTALKKQNISVLLLSRHRNELEDILDRFIIWH